MQGRILIADDNPAVRRTLRQLLEGAGFGEIIDTEDGQAALSRAIEVRPDVIVLDLAMPVMDGLSAAREISKALPEATILMYTMHWSAQLELEAKKCGVRMLVSKSQSSVLLAAVKELLDARQSKPQGAGIELVAPAPPPDAAATLPALAETSTAPNPVNPDLQKTGAADAPKTPTSVS